MRSKRILCAHLWLAGTCVLSIPAYAHTPLQNDEILSGAETGLSDQEPDVSYVVHHALPVTLVSVVSVLSAPDVTELQAERSIRIAHAFNELNIDTIGILDEFYAADVEFEDPLVEIRGLEDLRAYYTKLYRRVEEIAFEIEDEVAQGDTHVVFWTMRLKARKMNNGEEISLEGNSILRFGEDEKVIYHRDYFDLNEFIYQHVPVLKHFTRYINKRVTRP